MLLTLASAGNKKVDIYGGKNLTHLLASARNFVFRMSTRVETHEVDEWSQRFKDENLEVDYVFATTSNEDLSDNHNNKILHDSDNMRLVQKVVAEMFKTGQSLGVAVPNSLDDKIGSKDDARLSSISKKTFHQLSLPMGTATATTITGGRDGGFSGDDYDFDADMQEETEAARSRPLEPCKRAITFICQGLNVKGRFQPQEASRLGCTPGSDFGLLHEGQTIQLSSDDFVRPHQVVSKERTGSIFIVVDCPTAAYIKSLVSNPKFVPHYKNELNSASGSDGSHVKCIIHKLGQAAVLESAMYNAWMAKFGGETQHVIICPEYSPTPVTYKGAALSAARLSMLDPDVFRIPLYKNTALRDFHEIKAADYKCTIGKSMQIIDLEPAVGVNESELSLSFDHTDPEGKFVKGLNKLVEYKRACLDIKEKVANGGGDNSASLPHSAVRITTLGTAASLPSRYRNVSSTMISIDVKGGEGVNGRHCPRGILLDAGEGTYGQMTRSFPEEELLDILAGLECIFISHMHADHHLGVVRILIERERAIKGLANDIERRRLFIVGPTQYWTWLTELSGVQDIGNLTRDFCWIDSKDLLADCGSEKR